MPAIWSSSERPISVRMVWVDGIRHAILSHDDPLFNVRIARRRPQSTTVVKDKNHPLKFQRYKSATVQKENCFDGCVVKFHLVVDKNNSPNGLETSPRSFLRQQSAPICTRVIRNNSAQRSESSDDNKKSAYYRPLDSDRDIEFEEEDAKFVEMSQLNTLSERVLQWLDLSGKVRDFDLGDLQVTSSDSQEGEEEKKPAAITARRKSLNFKDDQTHGTSMKIILPSKYLTLQEKTAENAVEMSERKLIKRREIPKNLRDRKISADSEKSEETCKVHSKANEDENNGVLQTIWTPQSKPQLHIFMPNLKSINHVQCMSSQESLFCE